MKKVYLFGFMAATAASWVSASADTVAVTTPPAGCPKAFQGFHLGGNIGVGFLNNKQTASRADNGTGAFVVDQTFSNKMGGSGVDGGIGVGYTHRFCNWALGIAFDANWANSSGTLKRTEPANNGLTTSLKSQLQNSLQLYARLGYVMREIAMPFIGLGWDNSQWKHTFTNNFANVPFKESVGKNHRFNSFLWKMGVDFLATKHVVVGFEYTGTVAGSKSVTKNVVQPNGVTVDQLKATAKPQYNKFALTAKIVY